MEGPNDASWDFSSSLFRLVAGKGGVVTEDQIREKEQEVLAEADRWGLGRDLGPSATEMHMLAILQHHGVPTRLIDVTANPMTAMWFASEEHKPDDDGLVRRSDGVVFAIDVTETKWYETFRYATQTHAHLSNPLKAGHENALAESASSGKTFRVFSALPDERMKAQEGFFLGAAVPERHEAPGIRGMNPPGPAPGDDVLAMLRANGRKPESLPFCAIVIPAEVKTSSGARSSTHTTGAAVCCSRTSTASAKASSADSSTERTSCCAQAIFRDVS